MSDHKPGRRKDGQPWWDSRGREWQRWWCGKNHKPHGGQCNVSIPRLTGRTRGAQ